MAPPVLKAGPVTRVCHVCGRQYGLSSFEIHLKQCKKLWVQQEEQKPKNERRPIPKTPPGIGEGSGDTGKGMTREEVEALNQAAQETFNVHGMETCEFCGRTFAEGRLAIHNKSCRADSVAKKVVDGAVPRNKKGESKSLSCCDKSVLTTALRAEPAVDYGRARPRLDSSASDRSDPDGAGESTGGSGPSRPTTSGGGARALSGSLASNRKKIAGQESGSTSKQRIQSPLEQKVDAATLSQELQRKESMISIIQAKLDHWEATTVATLQEIRDLKEVFAQLSS